MRAFRFIVLLLLVIGALNWGLVGFFQYDLVADLFGMMTPLARIIYGLVGIAGLCGICGLIRCCRSCDCGPNCSCCTTTNKKHRK